MTPNNYFPDSANDDDASPDYLFLDSSLKRKICPNSMLKLNLKIKKQ